MTWIQWVWDGFGLGTFFSLARSKRPLGGDDGGIGVADDDLSPDELAELQIIRDYKEVIDVDEVDVPHGDVADDLLDKTEMKDPTNERLQHMV